MSFPTAFGAWHVGVSLSPPPPVGHVSKIGPTFEEHLRDCINVFRLSVKVAEEEAGVRRERLEFTAGNVDERVRAGGGVVVRVSIRPAVGIDNVNGTASI